MVINYILNVEITESISKISKRKCKEMEMQNLAAQFDSSCEILFNVP